jgi:FkbM family methyltransferase
MDINQYVIDNAQLGVMLDIGANYGIYTEKMSARATSVYSFEPSQQNFITLTKATEKFKNVICVKKAISNQNGIIKLYSGPGCHHGQFSIDETLAAWGGSGHNLETYEEVETITLDEFCKANNITNITAIKIDVECAEQSVLEGAKETLTNNNPLIALETHNPTNLTAIYNLFADYGYSVYKQPDQKVLELQYNSNYICAK